MNKQRRLIGVLFLIIAFLMLFRLHFKDRKSQKKALENLETSQKIYHDVMKFSQNKDKIYSEVLEKLSAHLFTNLSGSIRIDKIEYSDSIVKYLFVLLEKPQIAIDDFVAINKPDLVNFLKEEHRITTLFSDKMPFLYVYRDSEDKIFAEILITPEDYK